jgi:pimeloyl-ACP methyl ester carboxylesterase
VHTGRSEFIRLRGLRYHVRRWGDPLAPPLFLLHGFLDVSGTFALVAEPLSRHYQVLAPDFRGFGYTEWPADGYWFEDYIGDLDALVDHYSPAAPAVVVGHSMGSQIGALYAGARPERVSRLVLLDGVGLRDVPADHRPKRVREWLDELKATPRAPPSYPSFEALAERVRNRHPRLSPERALFVAHLWGREDGFGRISLCADPKHLRTMPALYRVEESEAMWRAITARTLLVFAEDSELRSWFDAGEVERRMAFFHDHRVAWIAKAGHMLHLEAPEHTAALIAEFLATP